MMIKQVTFVPKNMLNLKIKQWFHEIDPVTLLTKSIRPYSEMKNTNIYMVTSMMNRNVESKLRIPF